MKVLLVNPPLRSANAAEPLAFPLGLGYLAAALRQAGHSPLLLDACLGPARRLPDSSYFHLGLTTPEILDRIAEIGPDLVGISIPFTSRAQAAIEIGRAIRAAFPDLTLVGGGMHATVAPQELLTAGFHEVLLGEASDPLRGEYPALNAFVTQATEGRMTRVFLHSVRDFPHSSCGCFAALAWWSEQLGGLCLMHRGFEGTAPDGSTWNLLANRAGGKQQPGITGVGPEYLRSPRFLQGDGGWAAVKWMTSKLQRDLVGEVPAVASIPTVCVE